MSAEDVSNKAAGKSLEIRNLIQAKAKALKLRVISGEKYLGRKITVSEVNRPGLALSGHLENFRGERIQIIGRGEHAYCSKEDGSVLFDNIALMLSQSETPCMIITAGLKILPVIKKVCNKAKIPLLHSELDTASFVGELVAFLEDQLSPVTRVHGVLVNVYGLGVLIKGGPGVGKSECALELVKRGHILVADDIVEIHKNRGDTLTGVCPNMLKHYMEVRGLGIIDVELLFGVGSIMDHSRIEMEVNLISVDGSATFDRTGLEQKTSDILGVAVPSISIPVRPGRNLAVLIEVAALNQRLRAQGIFAARDFNNRLIEKMKSSTKKGCL